jgi:tagatose 1,6-diphosphate aldolase
MGKYRHLCQCSTAEGHFVVLAIDHRAVLLDKLNQYAPKPLSDQAFVAFKQLVAGALIPEVSALLTDPAYGFSAGITQRVISGQTGLLAPLEVTEYSQHPSQRPINFIPGWSVAKIKRAGGAGVKLLLPFHPDEAAAPQKIAIVRQIVEDCARFDIPFFLEPIAHSLNPDHSLTNAELRQVVVEMARLFSAMDVDVLKMQFPVDAKQSADEAEWAAACADLDAACTVPWALLSAGVNYATFARQARTACSAGASGVIVGRAVWAEAVELQGEARAEFVRTTARERMAELGAICREYAAAWFDRAAPPDDSLNWYESYSE